MRSTWRNPPPHLAANAPVLRVAELGAVKGVTPRAGSPPPVPFRASRGHAGQCQHRAARSARRHRRQPRRGAPRGAPCGRAASPFTTIAEFRARLPEGATLASDVALSVKSSYFYVTIEARQGTTRSHARALLRRSGGGKPRDRLAGRRMTGPRGRVNYGDARALRAFPHDGAARSAHRGASGGPRGGLGAVRCRRDMRAHGPDRPGARPKADRVEFVLAAAQVRVARVTLPPLPSSRVADAARFALEDQLAGPDGTHHIAASAQARDGGIRVAVAARSLLASIAGSNRGVARILAEPELALPAARWTWCARDSDAAGFVRRPDGSAFPVDAPPPDGGLPSELTLALAQARRGGSAPSCIRVDAPFAASSLRALAKGDRRRLSSRAVPGAGKRHRPPRLRRHRSAASAGARSGSFAHQPGATLCPRARAGRRRALPPCRSHRRRMGFASLPSMAHRARMDRPCRRSRHPAGRCGIAGGGSRRPCAPVCRIAARAGPSGAG